MYKSGGTIKELVDRIADQTYLLPAIQREFVWTNEQVCELFDSIMQRLPFGTFLLWKIDGNQSANYQFYHFITDYHERDAFHCERWISKGPREFLAVVDGQQRMTALNVGLRGSISEKIKGRHWASNSAFPRARLHLNLVGVSQSDDQEYQFAFLLESRSANPSNEIWFRVGRVLESDEDTLIDELDDLKLDRPTLHSAKAALRRLYRTIHERDLVFYFEETSQSLDHVLNLFIRMNSGGTPLNYSDLLLSIAVAQWSSLDARESVHSVVDDMNQIGDGFDFKKDLVLKAGLMLSDIGSVGFKVENFNKTNTAILEKNWSQIADALVISTELLSNFGFSQYNLRAASSILPIAYYIYLNRLDESYLTKAQFADDRDAIRLWLIKSLLKASGIWGSGLDTLLTTLRGVLRDHIGEPFPLGDIEAAMTSRGKTLRFQDEEVVELAEIECGDKRTFALLSLLFPGPNYAHHHYHVDHIFPKAFFTRGELRKRGVPEGREQPYIERFNRVPNLQLLEGEINNEKRKKLPLDWASQLWPNPRARDQYLSGQAIDSLPADLDGFLQFYDARLINLASRIRKLLSN